MIIGKQPKRGATFADVKPGGYFATDGEEWRRSLSARSNIAFPLHVTSDSRAFDAEHPITPLTLTEAQPESDPALTTYGELRLGDHHLEVAPCGEVHACILVDTSPLTSVSMLDGSREYPCAGDPVRRLTPAEAADYIAGPDASVVLHGSSGRYATVSDHGGDHVNVNGFSRTAAWTAHLAQDIVAVLADLECRDD